MSMGPAVCRGLKNKLGASNVACQGVGGAYRAGLAENVYPKGTTDAAIKVAKDHFQTAAKKCPQSLIVAGGYRWVLLLIGNQQPLTKTLRIVKDLL
jgi:cutinase